MNVGNIANAMSFHEVTWSVHVTWNFNQLFHLTGVSKERMNCRMVFDANEKQENVSIGNGIRDCLGDEIK